MLKTPGYLEIAGIPKKEEEDSDPKELLHLADQLKKGDEISVDGYEVKEEKLHRRSGTPPVPWCLPWKMQDS